MVLSFFLVNHGTIAQVRPIKHRSASGWRNNGDDFHDALHSRKYLPGPFRPDLGLAQTPVQGEVRKIGVSGIHD